jgi:hypothetical protein
MKRLILPILLGAFLIRFLLPLFAFIYTNNPLVFHSADTGLYIEPATQLLATGRFLNKDGLTPDIEYPPGYPLLLLPGLLLNNPEGVTIGLQIILSCLTVYLVYQVALLLSGGKVKLSALCAGLYAVEPLSILYTTKLMSETLYTTILMVFLYCFCKYIEGRRFKYLIFSAIALGVSTYVRPISYYLPFLISIFLLIWIFTKIQKKKIFLVHTCLFFVISMGIIGVWEVRNRVVAGYPGFAAGVDVNLYFYKAASVLAVKEKIPFVDMQKKLGFLDREIYYSLHPELRNGTQTDRYLSMREDGKKILAENRLVYLILHLKGIVQVLSGPGAGEYISLFGRDVNELGKTQGAFQDSRTETAKSIMQKDPVIFGTYALMGVLLFAYILLAAVGLISYRNWLNNIPFMALLSLGFYLLAAAGGQSGYSRFRHPLMPLICILAGYGLSVIFDKFSKKNSLEEQSVTE